MKQSIPVTHVPEYASHLSMQEFLLIRLPTPTGAGNNLSLPKNTSKMKTFFVLSSVILGSSLLASDMHTTYLSVAHKRYIRAGGPIGTVSIIIDKSDYELSVYD